MNYFDLYSSCPDQTITAAWEYQVTEATRTPWLREVLLRRGGELFPRFAACYAELRSLRRSARRALQHRIARSSEFGAMFPEWLQTVRGHGLQHDLARSVAGAALLLALGQGVATAATMTVTTDDPRINADGQCSLMEAIVNANADAAIHADCPAGNGADTIVLPANADVGLGEVNDNTYGPTSLPLITSRISIEGNGATLVRRASRRFRLMSVSNLGDLTLRNITLSRGSHYGPGGAATNHGILTIENCTISGNVAQHGGAVFNSDVGTLNIQTSTITKNRASSGGGIKNYGDVIIQGSTVSGNTAAFGGGVYNSTSYGSSGNVTIANSTISGNTAEDGGGVFNSFYCGYYYYYCYFGTLNLNRSLISGNRAATGPEIENFGTINADNFNLFGANGRSRVVGFTPGLTDIVPARGVRVGKILDRLKDNGGPTKTHALKPGSPALDVVPFTDPSCTGTDQRGIDRPRGTGCDIGAFERIP